MQPLVLEHILRKRRHLVVLGPRQVGKTTILKQVVDDLLKAGWPAANISYFDFSDERVAGKVTPRKITEVQPSPGPSTDRPRILLLDEITYSEGRWDLWLKQDFDHGLGNRIVVTDSAASLLRRGGIESGQGRWDEFLLEGLTFREFVNLRKGSEEGGPDPGLFELFLSVGGFPEHAFSDGFRLSEVHASIRADIANRAIYRDLADQVDVAGAGALFAYFAEVSGSVLNVTDRANDLDVNRRTITAWLSKLEGAGLLVSLPAWSASASKKMRRRSKIYTFDHGLVLAFGSALRIAGESLRGRVFETLVFRELRQQLGEWRTRIGYFRENKIESDFVIDTDRGVTAIEVTQSRRIRGRKLQSLERASEAVKATRAFLIHGGLDDEKKGVVQLLPIARFLTDPTIVLGG